MIVPPSGVRVLITTRPVDFRRGADGLAAVVQTVLRQDPFSGTIYVFRCKRADRVKLLVWDGSGLVLIWKRLETDVAPGFRTGRFFSYAALAMVMSTLACAGVRYPTLEWRRCRL